MDTARILNLLELLKKKSFFLFGPRTTGKTTLIRKQLKDSLIIDLLKSDLYLRLSANPGELENIIQSAKNTLNYVVIDEVQKIPLLLDEVHRLIEEKKLRFLLTGSSARKLKRGHANLLAGRAWIAELFPLVWKEISNFDLNRYLRYGGLPTVYFSENPEEELQVYVKMYLYEEIQAEGLVRKLPQFSRFLITAALSNGQLLNYANVGNDAQVSASTVRDYYGILEDTLLGFNLMPWTKTKKRKAISTAKFYFFDTGVTHALSGTKTLDRNSDLYGKSFEHWIAMELRAYLSYRRIFDGLAFWRSANKQEVDFLIGEHTAIEVKATKKASGKDFRGLRALAEEKKFKNYYFVSHDPIEAKVGNILCIPWQKFIVMLWDDSLF